MTFVGVGSWANSGAGCQTLLPGECPVPVAGNSSHPRTVLEQLRSSGRP